jgi:hypothetical protein
MEMEGDSVPDIEEVGEKLPGLGCGAGCDCVA